MRAAATGLEQPVAGLQGGHAKVGNLDVLLSVKQQILWLEIPMTDVEAVAVVYAGYDLLEVPRRLVRRQSALRHQVVEQLATLDVLEDEVAALRSKSCMKNL